MCTKAAIGIEQSPTVIGVVARNNAVNANCIPTNNDHLNNTQVSSESCPMHYVSVGWRNDGCYEAPSFAIRNACLLSRRSQVAALQLGHYKAL